MIFDWLFKKEEKEEPKLPSKKRAYLLVNNYPYPLKAEMVDELLALGAPVVWLDENGEVII